jgi:hypothetical protein
MLERWSTRYGSLSRFRSMELVVRKSYSRGDWGRMLEAGWKLCESIFLRAT